MRVRIPLNLDYIRQRLEAIANDIGTKPPTIVAIAQSFGCRPHHLHRNFPDLCSKTIARHFGIAESGEIEAVLKNYLMSDPPVPMRRVDEDLGYKRGFLKQYYPELCSEISERYRRFEIEAKQQRIERISQAIRQAGRELHAENIYPGIQAVERAINVKGFHQQRLLVLETSP